MTASDVFSVDLLPERELYEFRSKLPGLVALVDYRVDLVSGGRFS